LITLNYFIKPLIFLQKWEGIADIYKITYLKYKIFTYYGSSKNLGARLKYHFYTSPTHNTFLGLFLNTFTWKKFSISIIETCTHNNLKQKED
jgi:hemolysin activation/secretion protein